MSSFRKLLDIGDESIRKELGDYYFISKNVMENYLHCLESQANKISALEREQATLRAEVERLNISIESLIRE